MPVIIRLAVILHIFGPAPIVTTFKTPLAKVVLAEGNIGTQPD
jgi:hypothetical protein